MSKRNSTCVPAGAAVRLVAGLAVLAMAAASLPAAADVKTSTSTRYYSVSGTTASALVSYMRSHPIQGDYGNAIANIRPRYSLSVATSSAKGACRATNVTLRLNFSLTLPKARSISSMSSGTRSAWNAFASYARRHEEQHRRIYIGCANRFVAKATKMSAGSCVALKASINRLLESEKRACEAKNRAFDRNERSRVAGLSLFRMAKSRAGR